MGNSATILLHEAFCDTNDRSPTSSLARCLTSSRCIVNSTYLLYASSNDLSGCDPSVPPPIYLLTDPFSVSSPFVGPSQDVPS